MAHRDALIAELNRLLAAKPAAEWFAALSEAGVPCGPINDVADAFALAERLELDAAVEVGGMRQTAHPVRFGATPAAYRCAPPGLDADGDGIRAWLSRPSI